LRNIGGAKYIVYPTNPTVGRATARLAHYVPAPMISLAAFRRNTTAQGDRRTDRQSLWDCDNKYSACICTAWTGKIFHNALRFPCQSIQSVEFNSVNFQSYVFN